MTTTALDRPKLSHESMMTDTMMRIPDFAIDPLFVARWSPRAFDGSDLTKTELLTLLEAARWAPSAYNAQPWRFIYALRGDESWQALLGALVPFNQSWASSASALVFILSDRHMRNPDGSSKGASHSHSFDAGAAWANLALQATRNGLQTHGMSGFDEASARAAMNIPDDFRVEAAIAIGRIGNADALPEGLRRREHPSDRLSLQHLAFEGRWPD
jgi:nitroreductase